MKQTILAAAILAALMLAGCQSDLYYQDQAVQTAREYLLENAPELTSEQRDFVMFNAPALLYDPAATGGKGMFLTSVPGQICVTWKIPGKKQLYMVVGFSDSRMMSWSPNRLVRREFLEADQVYLNAVNAARRYIYAGEYVSLTPNTANLVRFSEPEICRSSFAPDFGLNADAAQKEAFLKSIEGKVQYAMVWAPTENPDTRIVVFGYSKENLDGWTANSGDVYQLSELNGKLGAKWNREAAE